MIKFSDEPCLGVIAAIWNSLASDKESRLVFLRM